MQPKVSIIIPVYNVEKYLRQCLDSVVNQTLEEIQIICVNDGSTDDSLQILREYEARDSRLEVVDKPNGGQSSARNAGIERVRGEYIYFLDSDDWIEPTLCEKAYYRLESTGGDVVFFFHYEVPEKGQEMRQKNPSAYCRYSITPARSSDFIRFLCVPWNRVIRTSFFQGLGVRFPEVFLPEDLYMHWVLLVNEPHVECISEKLYYHRLRRESIIGQDRGYLGRECQAFSLIKDYFQRIGKYEQYRALLLIRKISHYRWYTSNQKNVHPEALRWFRESMDDEEIDFLRKNKSIKSSSRSVLYLLGDRSYFWRYVWHTFNTRYLSRMIKLFGKTVKFFKQKAVREHELRIHELSEQLAQRDRIIVHLRNHQRLSELRVA